MTRTRPQRLGHARRHGFGLRHGVQVRQPHCGAQTLLVQLLQVQLFMVVGEEISVTYVSVASRPRAHTH